MCIACTPVNKYFAKELLFVFKLVENTVHLSSKILIQINLILKRKKKGKKEKKAKAAVEKENIRKMTMQMNTEKLERAFL